MSQPPVARRDPLATTHHGDTRVDDYYWLRDRDAAEVIAYLEAENAHTDARTAHTEALRKALFDEIVARIVEDDSTVPAPRGPWAYYHRTEEGRAYPIHCRERDGVEEVLLDVNALAEGHDYTAVGGVQISPDHSRMVWTEEHSGDEIFTAVVVELATRHELARIEGVSEVVWANDNDTLYYTTLDAAHRPNRVVRRRLGKPEQDPEIFREDDEKYHVWISRTRSGRFVRVQSGGHTQSEVWLLDADDPDAAPRVVEPRRPKVLYSVVHAGDRLFISHNDGAVNFCVVEAPVDDPGRHNWVEVLPHRDTVTVERIDAFADHLVIREREEGLHQLRVRRLSDGEEHHIRFDEPVYALSTQPNLTFDTSIFRFGYESLGTPAQVFDYDLETRIRVLRKEQPVRGEWGREDYVTERLWATAPDGARVPLSLIRRRDAPLDGSSPLYLQAYGSYGICYDPTFAIARLSLLDRGVICAIAHIRGGADMGRGWYEDGKLLHKRNTFTDFVACADHLLEAGYTAPDRLVIQGGSAGGLLMGAVLNLAPDRFHAVVANVPFVDVVNTMLDASIPLTVIEYDEWGNPNEPEFYAYMRSYSPYDNVEARPYPHLLVTAGLNDPRVQYWEPAKWVAKLRTVYPEDRELLLKTYMGAGHAGRSGRYGRIENTCFAWTFLLDKLGLVAG